MSISCSLSESSSGCSCTAPVGFLSLRLRDNALHFPAQPLVYYAGVPEVYRERQKSDKPNCFVKAFRWYTHEHGTKKSTAGETKDVGFATWLDNKYQQYLCDNHLKNAAFKSDAYVHSPPTNQEQATRKSVKRKGFQRVLSPWRKRRSASKSPVGGTTCAECNSSWQILLRPKSLSHLESETSAKKQSSSYGAFSRVNTVTSSDTQITVRNYSQRFGTVVREVTDLDLDNSTKENSNKIDPSDSQSTYVLGKKQSPPKMPNSQIEVKCECPVEANGPGPTNTSRTDASTQYDTNQNVQVKPLDNASRRTSKIDFCKATELVTRGSLKDTCPATKEKHIKIDTGDKTIAKSPCACELLTRVPCQWCHRASKNNGTSRKHVRECQRSVCCHMRSANGSVQTSDYAITPRNDTYGLPLLLRVLPARQ